VHQEGAVVNEYIEVQFRRRGRTLKLRRQLPDGTVELDEPDPFQRRVGITFRAANEISRYRMRRIQQIKGWQPGEFRLRVSVEAGTLVLRGDDPFSLPEGRYELRVRLEEARTREPKRFVDVKQDGHAEFVVDVETDDRQVAVDLADADSEIVRVLEASAIDDLVGLAWLEDPDRRPARKACLLNLLAMLRVTPTLRDALIAHVQSFYWASNDRAYARVDAELLARLQALADDDRRPFYAEGPPKARIHRNLVLAIPAAEREHFSADRLLSFRAEGSPSLQSVVAVPPAGVTFAHAEFDLDLGNPLQDVVGIVVHLGELLDGKPTNHLDLWKKLPKGRARDHVHYRVLPQARGG
jgi:hypothetical protein